MVCTETSFLSGTIRFLPNTELLGDVRLHLFQCGVENFAEINAVK